MNLAVLIVGSVIMIANGITIKSEAFLACGCMLVWIVLAVYIGKSQD